MLCSRCGQSVAHCACVPLGDTVTMYWCGIHGRSGHGSCSQCASEQQTRERIAALEARLEATVQALHNAVRRQEALRQALVDEYADRIREVDAADRVQQDRQADADLRLDEIERSVQFVLDRVMAPGARQQAAAERYVREFVEE